jgi:hypothetical protein
MSKRTRLFVVVASASLVAGVGTAALSSYVGLDNIGLLGQGTDQDLSYVPGNSQVVAHADVRRLMDSDLRQRLKPALESAASHGLSIEELGLNLETDVDSLTLAALPPAAPVSGTDGTTPTESSLALVRGRFDAGRIEAAVRNQGGVPEDYRGARLVTTEKIGVAFIETGLLAVGHPAAVRAALDTKATGSTAVTTNDALMSLVRKVDEGNAWVVADFAAMQSSKVVPVPVLGQLPAITWLAASGNVTSGVSGQVLAEGRDETAAQDLREVVKGFVALARMQTGPKAELAPLLDSIELTSDGKTVAVKFEIPGQFFDRLKGTSAGRQAPVTQPRAGIRRVPVRPAA